MDVEVDEAVAVARGAAASVLSEATAVGDESGDE